MSIHRLLNSLLPVGCSTLVVIALLPGCGSNQDAGPVAGVSAGGTGGMGSAAQGGLGSGGSSTSAGASTGDGGGSDGSAGNVGTAGSAGDASGDAGSGGSGGEVISVPREQISANVAHTCALDGEGLLFCWSDGSSGRLGNGETEGVFSAPAAVLDAGGGEPKNDWAQVSAGLGHTCGVKTDGRAFCWGNGSNGRLGNGETAGDFATPVAVLEPEGGPAASDWAQLAAGGDHSCGLKKDGRLLCWGAASYGRLGNGGTEGDFSTPAAVLEPEGQPAENDWAFVSAGDLHVCALKRDGRLFCWGHGGAAQLGSGDENSADAPVAVIEADGGQPAADWSQVSAGPRHSCGLKNDGRLFCWGTGSAGQLGNLIPNGGSHYPTPLGVLEPGEGEPTGGWSQVSTGYSHSCALKQDGRLFCWGVGGVGALGNNQPGKNYARPQAVLEPLAAPASDDWEEVSAGWHFGCAIKQDGRQFCWGQGNDGHLGNGDDANFAVPVAVLDPEP